MKYLAVFVILALVGEITSAPKEAFPPKFKYRVNKNKAQVQESVEEASDEDQVADEPQGDVASEENEEQTSFGPRQYGPPHGGHGERPNQQFGYNSGGNPGNWNQNNQQNNQPKQWNQQNQWNSPQEKQWNSNSNQEQQVDDQRPPRIQPPSTWNSFMRSVVRPSRFFRSSFRDDEESDEEEDDDEEFNDNVIESDIQYSPSGGRGNGGQSFRAYNSNSRPVSSSYRPNHRPNHRPNAGVNYNNREPMYAYVQIPASRIRYVQRPYYEGNQQYVPSRRNQYAQTGSYYYQPVRYVTGVRTPSVAYQPLKHRVYGEGQRQRYPVRRTYVPMRSHQEGQRPRYHSQNPGSSGYYHVGNNYNVMRQMRNQRFWK